MLDAPRANGKTFSRAAPRGKRTALPADNRPPKRRPVF